MSEPYIICENHLWEPDFVQFCPVWIYIQIETCVLLWPLLKCAAFCKFLVFASSLVGEQSLHGGSSVQQTSVANVLTKINLKTKSLFAQIGEWCFPLTVAIAEWSVLCNQVCVLPVTGQHRFACKLLRLWFLTQARPPQTNTTALPRVDHCTFKALVYFRLFLGRARL